MEEPLVLFSELTPEERRAKRQQEAKEKRGDRMIGKDFFSHKSNLRKLETEEFQCGTCGSNFNSEEDLDFHIENSPYCTGLEI